MFAGSSPELLVTSPPTSILEATCAASAVGASNAAVNATMATFGSGMTLRARTFRRSRRRRHFGGRRASRVLSHPVLQGSTWIQPSQYVAFHTPEQAREFGLTGPILPESNHGGGRVVPRHT